MINYIERFVFTQDGQDYCLLIEQDQDGDNPRNWSNLGHMYCWHNRYILGDENPYADPEDLLDELNKIPEDDIVILQVEMYDHSGITVYAAGTRISDPWDSGQIGWIYATREDADAYGCAWEDVEKILLGEIEMYDKYISGECYLASVCRLEDDYDEDNIEAYIADTCETCGGIYTRESYGIGLAEEVLEILGYEYDELHDI